MCYSLFFLSLKEAQLEKVDRDAGGRNSGNQRDRSKFEEHHVRKYEKIHSGGEYREHTGRWDLQGKSFNRKQKGHDKRDKDGCMHKDLPN